MKEAGSTGAALIGWQTLLADLSLILFMVTAAAMSGGSGSKAKAAPTAAERPGPASSEPLAVWRAGGSQTLGQWLAREQPDSRQQLTITVHYGRGAASSALAAAQALVSHAEALGQVPRVIIAPATDPGGDEVMASLAYDRTLDRGTAQGLRNRRGVRFARTPP